MIHSPEKSKLNGDSSRKPTRPEWRGLAFQLFTIVILPLSVLMIITTFAGFAVHQQTMRDLAANRDRITARIAANMIGELINQRISLVNGLAGVLEESTSLPELEENLANAALMLNDPEAGQAYFDTNGNLLASVGNISALERIPESEWSRLLQIAGPGTPSHHLIYGQGEHSPLLVLIESSADRSVNAVISFLPYDLIRRSVYDIVDDESARSVYVITPDLQVLFNIGNTDLATQLVEHFGVEQALFGQNGATYLRHGSEEHIVAYSPVEPFGWALVLEEPWETVASHRLRLTENVPLVLIPIFVLALLALWFSNRYIVRPLQALEIRAAELGWGNFGAIKESVGGIEEIRNLQDELIHLSGKVQAAQKGLRDYIGAMTVGQEEERRRLSRELHDDTLQAIIALNQRLQLAHLAMGDSPQTHKQAEMLAQLQEMAAQTIQDLRRMTQALRPAYLEELGLIAALKMLAREVEKPGQLKIDIQLVGVEERLASEIELALYRIAQEALNNVVKHSQASHAYVIVAFSPELIRLEVGDNGIGFDIPESPAAFAPSGHFGLLGLYERAEMIGARLNIQSEAGEGSRITVEVTSTIQETTGDVRA